MMGSANGGSSDRDSDLMESLPLDEQMNGRSYASYRSVMSYLSDSHNHPLAPRIVTTPADSDPLLCPPQSPPPFRELGKPSASSSGSYPEPHSYLDLNFGSFDGDDNIDSALDSPKQNSDVSIPGTSGTSEYIDISVSNPQKEQEDSNSIVPGGNTHITYLITTKTNIAEYRGTEFRVRRRFKEVVALSDRLSETFRGHFIPPRPDKSVVEGQVMHKQEFVGQRRVALEKYLRRLAAHPAIKKSDELRVFLQVQGSLPFSGKTDAGSRILDGAVQLPKQLFGDSAASGAHCKVGQPAKGGRDLMRMLKELKESVSNDWTRSKPPAIAEDKEFLEKKEKLHDIEHQLSNTSKQAESLVKAQQDIGERMGELGLAFIKLTKFENESALFDSQKKRAADMKAVATAAIKASRLYKGLNTRTVKHLDTLHEYLGLMLAVHSAFSERSSALLTLQTLMSELSSLHTRAEKLGATSSKDRTKTRKIEELKETIRITEDAKQCAVREYERIKENNRCEVERFDIERRTDFLNMFKGFAKSQVGYAEKIANVWTEVAEATGVYAKDNS